MKNKLFAALALTLLCAFNSQLSTASAQGTTFGYEGHLNDGGNPANGTYDFQFTVRDAPTGGIAVGANPLSATLVVSNGLFTTTLDPGAGVFDGADRWLEIAVRTNGAALFTTLGPRQQIRATPYAIYSASAGSAATANTAATAASANSVSGANITGTISDTRLSANVALLTNPTNTFSGAVTASSFTGSGAGVTNIQLGTINSGGAIAVGTFVLASSPDVGPGVNFVTAADVNGDGKIDMVVVNGGGASFGAITVLTNDGSGGFVLAATMNVAVGYYPTAVAVADVNGDGKMDLISGNNDAGTLTVLTNNGSGGWVSVATLGVGAHAASVAAADVNGDGKVDLISANFNDSTLTVLTNNGSGAFAISSSPGVGSHPEKVAAVDVNGDGKVDLVSENHFAGTLTVLTNDGSGNFVLASTLSVGPNPQSLAAADLNGDGKVDLISASSLNSTLTVLTNNGGGGFALAATLAVGPHPLGVTAADVNGDGKVDLISANYNDSTLTVLLNNGNGSFVLASTLNVGAGPQSLVAADVNGDGKPDLLSANASDNTVSVLFNVFNVVTFNGNFTGNGANVTNLNASNLASGTISDARLSANVALLNGSANFSGTVTASSFTGDGAGLTNLNAVSGSGTTGSWTKWTGSGAIGNALASDDGTSVSILAAWAGQVSISGGPSQSGNAHVSIFGGNYHYTGGDAAGGGVRRGGDVRIYGGGTEYGAAFGGNVLIAAGVGSHFNGWDDGYIQLTGLTGIGTTARPTAGLELNGTLKITDGSQGAGKILTSDANGLASWQAAVGGLDTNNVALLNANQTFSGNNTFLHPILVGTSIASAFSAGSVTISAGPQPGSGSGGSVVIQSGAGAAGNFVGDINLTAASVASGVNGNINITASDNNGGGGNTAGSVNIRAGNQTGAANGGTVSITGGAANGANSSQPGGVAITGGANTGNNPQNGAGASVTIAGGAQTAPAALGPGGSVILRGGVSSGSGAHGSIVMQTGAASATRMTVDQNGNVGIGKANPATVLDVNGAVTATSFSGSGAGLINISADAIAGGLTTNIAVLVAGGGTNTLCFTNGVLRAVQ